MFMMNENFGLRQKMKFVRRIAMEVDFKKKRIEYLNNWPNVQPFEIERKYYSLVEDVKKLNGTIFTPFSLKINSDVLFNKAVSFLIEAMDQIERYPNFSYEFIFKALDCFMENFYTENITDGLKQLCDNEWKNIIKSNIKLRNAFDELFAVIPVKSCQYLYLRLSDESASNKSYQRVTTSVSGGSSSSSDKRKDIVDSIKSKYRVDFNNYEESIRKASLLYRYILKHDSVTIGSNDYKVKIDDKLHILVSGFLYSLRNDIMHGSSISITKSSKTTLGAFAFNYYGYLLLYYLLILLIVEFYKVDYPKDVYDNIAINMKKNIELYRQLFGKEIEY